MSNHNNHIETEELLKYLQGKLDGKRAHEIEKQALDDPFLADALEGLEEQVFDDVVKDITYVQKSVIEHSKSDSHKSYWKLAAAVALLLVASSVTFFLLFNEDQPTQLTYQEKSQPKEEKSILLEQSEDLSNKIKPQQNSPDKMDKALEEKLKATYEKKIQAELKESEEKANNKKGLLSELVIKNDPKRIDIKKENKSRQLIDEKIPLSNLQFQTSIDDSKVNETTTIVSLDKVSKTLKGSVPGVQVRPRRKKKVAQPIAGRVLDENNEPLPGANVVIKGTSNGTITNLKGEFEIDIDSMLNSTLTIAFVGYNTKNIDIRGKQSIDVALGLDSQQLEEVVVVGYGTQSKKSITGTSSVIQSKPTSVKQTFEKYVEENIKTPSLARENNIKGKVVLQFTITASGNIKDISIKKSLGFGCDQEAVRLINEYPNWEPAMKGNQPVDDNVKVRIKFE